MLYLQTKSVLTIVGTLFLYNHSSLFQSLLLIFFVGTRARDEQIILYWSYSAHMVITN